MHPAGFQLNMSRLVRVVQCPNTSGMCCEACGVSMKTTSIQNQWKHSEIPHFHLLRHYHRTLSSRIGADLVTPCDSDNGMARHAESYIVSTNLRPGAEMQSIQGTVRPFHLAPLCCKS